MASFFFLGLTGRLLHRISARGRGEKTWPVEQGHYVNLAVAPEGDALLMRKLPGSDLTHPAWGKAPGLYRYGLKDDSWERVADEGGAPMEGQMAECLHTRTWGGPDGGSTVKSASRTHATSSLARSMHLSPWSFLAFVEGYLVASTCAGCVF